MQRITKKNEHDQKGKVKKKKKTQTNEKKRKEKDNLLLSKYCFVLFNANE